MCKRYVYFHTKSGRMLRFTFRVDSRENKLATVSEQLTAIGKELQKMGDD